MYININKEALVITHKHPEHRIVNMLAGLECAHHATLTTFCDDLVGFAPLSEHELKVLIKNSNGPDVAHVWSRETLEKILVGMCAALPIFGPVNPFELDRQLAALDFEDGEAYRYVHGSYVARPAAGLEELALAYAAGAKPVQAPEFAPTAAQSHTPAPTPAPQAPKPASTGDFVAPREGTSTFQIFTFCANAWAEIGYNEDEAALAGIKRRAVETLTNQGLNISTVRVQSQRWYQNRRAACGLA